MPEAALVVSLDFELAWGLRTSAARPLPRDDLARVGQVVPALLAIFERCGISATWATVGHLMLRGEDCPGGRFHYDLPEPQFPWFEGRWYEGVPPLGSDAADSYYAPKLVDAIVACDVYQELASHTFTHVTLGDASCSEELARRELTLTREMAQRWGREISSIVFPRNQVGHLAVLRETGHRCYRGRNSEWYWFGRPAEHFSGPLRRGLLSALRYWDERRSLTPSLPPVRRVAGIWEIPHSMFFPGMQGISKWIPPEARYQRAAAGLHRAVQQGRVFSLWTHPHNFLTDPERLLPVFEQICQEARRLADRGDLRILSMGQMAELLDAGEGRHWADGGAG